MEIGVRTCSYKVQCNYCNFKHSKYTSSYLSLVCLHSLDTLKLLPGHTTAMPPEVTTEALVSDLSANFSNFESLYHKNS